jgi:hypothetical protein
MYFFRTWNITAWQPSGNILIRELSQVLATCFDIMANFRLQRVPMIWDNEVYKVPHEGSSNAVFRPVRTTNRVHEFHNVGLLPISYILPLRKSVHCKSVWVGFVSVCVTPTASACQFPFSWFSLFGTAAKKCVFVISTCYLRTYV